MPDLFGLKNPEPFLAALENNMITMTPPERQQFPVLSRLAVNLLVRPGSSLTLKNPAKVDSQTLNATISQALAGPVDRGLVVKRSPDRGGPELSDDYRRLLERSGFARLYDLMSRPVAKKNGLRGLDIDPPLLPPEFEKIKKCSFITISIPVGTDPEDLIDEIRSIAVYSDQWTPSQWRRNGGNIFSYLVCENPAQTLKAYDEINFSLEKVACCSALTRSVDSRFYLFFNNFGTEEPLAKEFIIQKVPAQPTLTSFEADPAAVAAGQSTELKWQSAGARKLFLSWAGHQEYLEAESGGSRQTPDRSTVYTLRVSEPRPAGQARPAERIAPVYLARPEFKSFSLSEDGRTLSWEIENSGPVFFSSSEAPQGSKVDGRGQKAASPGLTWASLSCGQSPGLVETVHLTRLPVTAEGDRLTLTSRRIVYESAQVFGLTWQSRALVGLRLAVAGVEGPEHILSGPAGRWVHPFAIAPSFRVTAWLSDGRFYVYESPGAGQPAPGRAGA